MSKRKKHISQHSLDKIKQLQHKNEFARRLKILVTSYSGKEAAAQLTTTRIESIYRNRMHTLKLLPAEGSVIPPDDKKLMECFLLNSIKEEKIIATDGSEYSFSDYLTIGLSFYVYVNSLIKNNQSNDEIFCKTFASFKAMFMTGEDANKRLYRLTKDNSFLLNDIGTHHYWIDPEIKFTKKDDLTVGVHLNLHRTVPHKTTFIIDNQPRPAIQLGWAWPKTGVTYLQLRPSQLGISDSSADTPMDVYIQSHALQRLSERLDCMDKIMQHFMIGTAINNPKVVLDTNGKMLIEYHMNEYKAGYLRADIVDGCILIRTFLFLTNNGTPEGEKLKQMTGLGKLDKKYLAIDKLSAFMSSDIRSNPAVMQLLRETGCECLLELHDKLKIFITDENNKQATGLLLSKYLALNNEGDKELLGQVG